MKVLVIDDSPHVREAVREMLISSNHTVGTAASAKTAIKMIEEEKYDFVLVDYKMPVNDGLWFMKNANIPKHTKTLLMTGYVDRKVIEQMFELGAVGYLIKPFGDKELQMHLAFHFPRT